MVRRSAVAAALVLLVGGCGSSSSEERVCYYNGEQVPCDGPASGTFDANKMKDFLNEQGIYNDGTASEKCPTSDYVLGETYSFGSTITKVIAARATCTGGWFTLDENLVLGSDYPSLGTDYNKGDIANCLYVDTDDNNLTGYALDGIGAETKWCGGEYFTYNPSAAPNIWGGSDANTMIGDTSGDYTIYLGNGTGDRDLFKYNGYNVVVTLEKKSTRKTTASEIHYSTGSFFLKSFQ